MGSFRSWVTSIFYIRLLMLSIGSKQEEQTPLVPSKNFLTMGAMRLHVRLKPWPLGALLCVEGTVSGSGYFTNTLILPVDNGPTEGLALIYVMHFLIGFLLSFLCLKRGRQKEKYLCCLLALLDLIF
ncbi:uncharacterized protein [Gossypium hirsutum]|uniref:Uncharacterized protein isoform X3 n=1 Tax=Gossypium hirsutum TaxID=3635 RepID=A0ABM3A9F3_GOSHI|nr:uncharacterized protein LOC107904891 isoform X3 [Gossypium hirsutum]